MVDPQLAVAIRDSIHTTLLEYRQRVRDLTERARAAETDELREQYIVEAERYQSTLNEMTNNILSSRQLASRVRSTVQSRREERRRIIDSLGPQTSATSSIISIPQTRPINLPAKMPENIPDEFICPITREIMTDPVMLTDGQVYDKKAITQWLHNNNTSPMTKVIVDKNMIIPCFILRTLIQQFLSNTEEAVPQQPVPKHIPKRSATAQKQTTQKTKKEPTQYNLFVKEQMPILKQQHIGMPTKELMKLIGMKWRAAKQQQSAQ